LLSGDWRYFSYSEPTYGLGTNAPIGTLPYYFNYNGSGEVTDSLTQPLKYNYFKFHQLISWRVVTGLYIGGGIHVDLFSKIQDEKLDTSYITSHYGYSVKYKFDPEKYEEVGVSLNFVYDTRDNQINAYKGIYANLNYRYNPEFLGSDRNSSSLYTEFRSFTGLSKKREDYILAFWFIGNFTVSGVQPYLALPALGNDQRSKSGRGYAVGRYRGENMVYGETEFRFPISKCTGTLGGVIFGNLTTSDNKDAGVHLFDYLQAGYGVGVRVLFNKKARMNIQVDYGKGNGSGGIYFGASEVF
jgi:outer membrane protein assembly factor BamA